MFPPSSRLVALVSLSLFAAACGGGGQPPPAPPAGSTPGFALSTATSALALRAGGGATLDVTATRTNGHDAAIQLSLANAPAGLTASGSIPAGAASGTLTVQAAAGFPPGELALSVTGTDGSQTKSAPAPLTLSVAGSAAGVHASTSYALGRNTVRRDWRIFANSGEMLTARLVLDLDADGVEDLFLAPGIFLEQGAGQPVRFYRGAREGGGVLSFAEATGHFLAGDVPHFNHARKVVGGDFNGDGRNDLFVIAHGYDAPPFPGTTNGLMLSGPDGKLAVSNQAWTGNVGFHHGGAAGDVDNDGDVDLFVCESQTGSFLLLNDGKGQFTLDRTRLPASLRKVTPIFVAELFDLDGDDFLDLAVAGDEAHGQPTRVYWGNGTGTFSDARSSTVPAVVGYPNVTTLAAEDLDGDGRRELTDGRAKGVYPEADFYKGYRWQVLRVGADRAVAEATDAWGTELNASAATMLLDWEGKPTWTEFYDVIDWDQDGRLDVVTSDGWNGNFWSRNLGSTFGALEAIPTNSQPASVSVTPSSVLVGTWGGTQQLTAEVRDASGQLLPSAQVQWSTSAPGVVQVTSAGLVTGVRAGQATLTATAGGASVEVAVTAAQLNPACIAPPGPVTPGATSAAPSFTQTEPQTMARPVYNPAFIVPVDYDRDGDQDVVVAETAYPSDTPYDARVAVYRNDSGALVETTSTAFSGSGKPDHVRDFEAADFNGDGRTDIYFANHGYDAPPFPGAPNLLLLGDGAGGGRMVDASDRLGSNPRSFTHASASADVDCDGDVDLYEGNAYEGTPSAPLPAPRLLLNDGTAHFTESPSGLPAFIGTYARKFLSAEPCDVDRDGDPDLVLGGFGGASELLMNDGFGRFVVAPIPMLPADAFPAGQDIEARCVDVDRDGWSDLLMLELDKPFADASGPVQRRQLVWRNRGDGTFEDVTATWMPPLGNTGFMTQLRPVDLNRDGWMDFTLSAGESGADRGMLVNDGSKFAFTQVKNQYGDTYGEALFELDLNGDGKPDLYQPRTNYTPAIYVQP